MILFVSYTIIPESALCFYKNVCIMHEKICDMKKSYKHWTVMSPDSNLFLSVWNIYIWKLLNLFSFQKSVSSNAITLTFLYLTIKSAEQQDINQNQLSLSPLPFTINCWIVSLLLAYTHIVYLNRWSFTWIYSTYSLLPDPNNTNFIHDFRVFFNTVHKPCIKGFAVMPSIALGYSCGLDRHTKFCATLGLLNIKQTNVNRD